MDSITESFGCNVCRKQFNNKLALGGHKDSHNRSKGMTLKLRGVRHLCLRCGADVTKESRPSRKRLYCNRVCMMEYRLMSSERYGVTLKYLEEYRTKVLMCEICGLPERAVHSNNKSRISNLAVDHNHKTGKFRGLLCSSCNRNLGWAENNLGSINEYLNR